MPLLDVTDVLLDPDFAQRLVVIRRPQTIDTHGRSVVVQQTLNPIGVLLAQPPPEFSLDEEASRDKRNIYVAAYNFRFLGPTNLGRGSTTQPDLVVFHATQYMVKKVIDWTDFGTGWSVAECEIQVLLGN